MTLYYENHFHFPKAPKVENGCLQPKTPEFNDLKIFWEFFSIVCNIFLDIKNPIIVCITTQFYIN